MVSSFDQMSDLVSTISQGQAPTHTVVDYAYVVYIGGRWHPGTFQGRAHECNEHIARRHGVDLTDPKVKWARGHITPDGQFVIHPATHGEAVYTLTRLLESKRRH